VQGHVDCTARILSRTPDGNALTLRFAPNPLPSSTSDSESRQFVTSILKYVVPKGFICLDGASLTITTVNDEEGWWEVMLIAYTQEKVGLGKKAVGEAVNVEVDMVGKYVEKQVEAYFRQGVSGSGVSIEGIIGRIVDEKLQGRNQ